MKFQVWAITLVAIAAAGAGEAQQGGKQAKPLGKPATRDFFKDSAVDDIRISPSGKYLAVLVPKERNAELAIFELDGMKPVQGYTMAADQLILDFIWINDRQVAWQAAFRAGSLDNPYYTGQIMVADADQAKIYDMSIQRESFAGRIRGSTDSIFVVHNDRIFRENVNNNNEQDVAKCPYACDRFFVDHTDKARAITGEVKGFHVTSIWDDAKQDWKELRRTPVDATDVNPVGFSADNQHLFLESNVESTTAGVYELDLASGESKLVYHNDIVDPTRTVFDPVTRVPAGVQTDVDFPEYHFFDANSAAAQDYAALERAFPNSRVHIANSSDDGQLAVVAVGSDVQPTEFYLFDLKAKTLRWLMSSRPWIDPKLGSTTDPFVLKARDGLALHGYLTLPKGAGEKNLPLVVLPHGGPMARDYWGYDEEVQFLAYHGYAVLQLNFRGSSGYGRDFEHMAYRHWGTTMQDDLTDATRWAVQEGIADPARICIYGGSYGGYAALMGAVREPDLYRCAVGYAGVYDLKLEQTSSDTSTAANGRIYLSDAHGDDEEDLKRRSAAYNADKIKASVLLIHGNDDQRVPFANFTEMADALHAAGKHYETMTRWGEGHGFRNLDNRVAMYDTLLDFLDRNIGPKRPGAAAATAPPADPAH